MFNIYENFIAVILYGPFGNNVVNNCGNEFSQLNYWQLDVKSVT